MPTKNKIDHLCIARTFCRSFQDAFVKRGADVALGRFYLRKETWQQEEFNVTNSNKLQVHEDLHEEEPIEQKL
ncbi:hypothetical protein DPMN_173472 [Dreissena polymorpha]|uniref:Uncharacterized protein n=1 Tax=Dreissena polymorpha TaxID=45954 RepID=A0A9D4E1P5_DREPO|nr:hypothetical protein DPMN_173472 [Dreissena polymorpha]